MVLPFNYYGLECPKILSSINHFDLLGMDPNRQPRYTYDELLDMARHVAILLAAYKRFPTQPPQPETGSSYLPYRAEHADAMIQYLESGAARGGPDLAVAAIYTTRDGLTYNSDSSWNPHIPNPVTSFTIRPEVAQPIPGRLPGLGVAPVYSSNSSTDPLPNAHVWASSGSNEDNVDVNPATLKGNAATSEQASTAGKGKKGIIKTVPETFPPGVPAGPPTHARGLATPISQGASSAFPSATNAIVKIEGEDGNLIQLINGLDEKLSKKLDEFRRSNISTRDENLSNLWKQATRARNKAEVAVLVDAAITAAATVRGKQVQRKADAQTRPMIQKLEELRKKEIAKYEIIIGEADQWTKVFQEMKRYLTGP